MMIRSDETEDAVMPETIQFVPASESDAASIVELRREIWASTYRGIYPDSMIEAFDSAWHREKELLRIRRPDYAVYLIVRGGLRVGYLTMRKAERITLQSLYILAAHQRQGIGKKAFDFIMRYCAKNGARSFTCQCVPENWNARRFYERMGGRIVGEDLDNAESWTNSVTYRFDV